MRGVQKKVVHRFLAEPTDANVMGNVHGGNVMKWIDQAAYTCAVGWAGQPAVTVYVGGIRFHKPIHVGDVVEIEAKLIYTGNTSMHIKVSVRAADPKTLEWRTTTTCVIVFVAVDEHGRKSSTPVPALVPETDEERKDWQYAEQFMEIRKKIEEVVGVIE